MTLADSSQPSSVIPATTICVAPTAVPVDQYSFFQALRQIERRRTSQPRIGYAQRPAEEVVRVGQPAELTFAPSTLTSASYGHAQSPVANCQLPPVEIQQRFLGLLGPAGPMPLHFTESVRDRQRHAGDESLQAFLDIFHHRMAILFYRAWSDAQPIVQHDRPQADKFARFLGSLGGASQANHQPCDDALNDIKRFHAGQFAGIHRHAEGLASILTRTLQVPASVQSFALRTLILAKEERTTLSSRHRGARQVSRTNQLGHSAQLGATVPDRTSMIEVQVGPVDYAQFQQYLPGGYQRLHLTNIVRDYAGATTDARVTVCLQREHVPPISLGQSGQLGRTCWLGGQPTAGERSDYSFEVSGDGDSPAGTPAHSAAGQSSPIRGKAA